MTNRTPGPWHVDTYCGKRAVLDGDSGVIAERVPNEADARLIAAAPELLAALREIDALDDSVVGLNRIEYARSVARAALAKVEG